MDADTLHRIVKNPKNPCRDSHRRRDGFFVQADNKPRLERMLRARRDMLETRWFTASFRR